jgi:hypothetical protein
MQHFIEANWDQSVKQAAAEKWPNLSEKELNECKGQRQHIMQCLIAKGRDWREVTKEMDDFEAVYASKSKPGGQPQAKAAAKVEVKGQRARAHANRP